MAASAHLREALLHWRFGPQPGAARRASRNSVAIKAAAVAAGKEKEDQMRVLSQTELARCTGGELSALLNRIASQLPDLREGSSELRNAHANLQNIRRALSRPQATGFGPR